MDGRLNMIRPTRYIPAARHVDRGMRRCSDSSGNENQSWLGLSRTFKSKLPFGLAGRRAAVTSLTKMVERSQQFSRVIAAIDAANAADPRTVVVDGKTRPYEVVYSERMTQRLEAMYPDASETLCIAAHGQHIRRFDIPRATFPQGREGYNQWRRTCREHHAALLSDIMSRHGYSNEEIERTARLVKKEQLKKDRDSQALENVVDVVFLEHYFDAFSDKYRDYDDDKMIDILGKTLRKMSPKGHQVALSLDLPERTRRLVQAAVEREARTLERLTEFAVDRD